MQRLLPAASQIRVMTYPSLLHKSFRSGGSPKNRSNIWQLGFVLSEAELYVFDIEQPTDLRGVLYGFMKISHLQMTRRTIGVESGKLPVEFHS